MSVCGPFQSNYCTREFGFWNSGKSWVQRQRAAEEVVEKWRFTRTRTTALSRVPDADGGLRGGTGMFWGNTMKFSSGAFASGWVGISLYRVVYADTPWEHAAVPVPGIRMTARSITVGLCQQAEAVCSRLPIRQRTGRQINSLLLVIHILYTITTQGFWAEITSNTTTTVTILSPISESGWTGFNNEIAIKFCEHNIA